MPDSILGSPVDWKKKSTAIIIMQWKSFGEGDCVRGIPLWGVDQLLPLDVWVHSYSPQEQKGTGLGGILQNIVSSSKRLTAFLGCINVGEKQCWDFIGIMGSDLTRSFFEREGCLKRVVFMKIFAGCGLCVVLQLLWAWLTSSGWVFACVFYAHDLVGAVWRRSTFSTDGQVSVCNVWLSENTSK